MWQPFYKMKPTKCSSALRRGEYPFIGDGYFFDREHFLYRCGVIGAVDVQKHKIVPAPDRWALAHPYILMWIERACFCAFDWTINPSRHLIVVKPDWHRCPIEDRYKRDKWIGLEQIIGDDTATNPLCDSRSKALKYAQSLEVDTTIKYLLDSEDHRLIDHALSTYSLSRGFRNG